MTMHLSLKLHNFFNPVSILFNNKLKRLISGPMTSQFQKPILTDDGISASTLSSNGLTGMGNTFDEATRHAGQRFSIALYITPWLSPAGTPENYIHKCVP